MLDLERDVQHRVMIYLKSLPHVFIERRNVVVRGKYKSGKTGRSDLWGIIKGERQGRVFGQHIEIEVKRPGKEPTEHQKDWLMTVRAFGGIAIWVDSLTMLIEKLRIEFPLHGLKWDTDWEAGHGLQGHQGLERDRI